MDWNWGTFGASMGFAALGAWIAMAASVVIAFFVTR